MAVGLPMKTTYANGDVYSASDVNDITGTVNLIGQTNNFYAGKNKIINGDFKVWQRGTSFSNPASGAYTADRFWNQYNGTGATRTISQQTFTAGTAPVSGYEGQFFYRYNVSAVGTGNTYAFFGQPIEDVRTFAGQTVTVSFWAKADAARTLTIDFEQYFGGGGSASVYTSQVNNTLTTSWARYTATISVASISGKTIGTNSYLSLRMLVPSATVLTVDVWGVQVEVGSTATAFQTATGTIQGELAACQRYYWRLTQVQSQGIYAAIGIGVIASSTLCYPQIVFPTEMRVRPTALEYANVIVYDGANILSVSAVALGDLGVNRANVTATISGGTQFRVADLRTNANGVTSYFAFSAEL